MQLDDIMKTLDPALFVNGVLQTMSKTEFLDRRINAEFVAKEIIKLVESDSNSTLNIQHGGDHYKKLGDYQPWMVLKNWLTPEEFRGYMKGTAITYLAREKNKGGNLDIEKAIHTLRALLELEK